METNLKDFITRITDEMRGRGQYSTAKTCVSVLRGLSGAAEGQLLTFASLTPGLLATYEHRLITNQRSRNTVSLYMRTLQSICNRAVREGKVSIPGDLFEKVFVGSDPVQHRAIEPEMIQRIANVELTGKEAHLCFARDMFMLSFFLRGISFIDLAHLRKCDVKDGVITYCRRKTQKPASVRIEACARKIIERYASLAEGTAYLLPIIREQGTADYERLQYESALRLYNKHLNRISKKMELGMPLTSYVARHSWATIAHDIGVEIADISEALCHSSEKMTRNYIRSFTTDRLAGVNRKVIACVAERKGCGGKPKPTRRQPVAPESRRSGSL